MEFYFKHPTTIQISGPTVCETTWFVLRILEEQLIQPFLNRIIWVYSEWQSDYEHVRARFSHMKFVESSRTNKYKSINPDNCNILILDNQMDEIGDSKTLSILFTKISHDRYLTVINRMQMRLINPKARGPFLFTRTAM